MLSTSSPQICLRKPSQRSGAGASGSKSYSSANALKNRGVGDMVHAAPATSDGKCTSIFFAGRISSAGQGPAASSTRDRAAGVPPGLGESTIQAGWVGTSRVDIITKLAIAWSTSPTRRLVTGIGRWDLDRGRLARSTCLGTRARPAAPGLMPFAQGQPV